MSLVTFISKPILTHASSLGTGMSVRRLSSARESLRRVGGVAAPPSSRSCLLMPEFEELPDDYEEVASAAKVPSSSSSAPAVATSAPACSSREALPRDTGSVRSAAVPSGLRKGFFNRSPSGGGSGSRPPETSHEPAPAPSIQNQPSSPAAVPSSAFTNPSAVAGGEAARPEEIQELEEFDEDDDSEFSGEDEDEDSADGVSPAELVDGLRRRIIACADTNSTGASVSRLETATRDLEELVQSLSGQAKIPPLHVRSSRERALNEADVALADMRASSNDARRLRSGEEKRAVADLRRAAEDALERVRKVADMAAPPRGDDSRSADERARRTVENFHSLPLAAKLRVLADDRVAVLTLFICFVGGFAFVLAGLLELFTAWNCGFRCGYGQPSD